MTVAQPVHDKLFMFHESHSTTLPAKLLNWTFTYIRYH